MNPSDFGKWIDGLGPGDQVADVARESLRLRLRAVRHYLPLAAGKPDEDVEYVHQLRVSTRRATAAMKLFRPLLPRKRARWLEGQLGRIRRAAGTARDCDVMRERFAAGTLGEMPQVRGRLQAARCEAQHPIEEVHRELSRPAGLKKHVRGLLRRVRTHPRDMPGAGPVRFDDWARFQLRPLVDQFFEASQPAERRLAVLHQFRIRGKKLRYAMELLAGAFAVEFRDELYPVVECLQEHLGRINDHATGIDRLRRWLAKVERIDEIRPLTRLLQEELDGLDQAVAEFGGWWTPSFESQFQRRFEQLLVPPEGRSVSVR